MIVRLDPAAPGSPAEQIVTQIAASIDAGEVAAGAPLPTIRALARDLGVAPGTVARAYADLERDGWVVAQGRRGTSVAPGRPKRFDDDVAAAARALARAVAASRLDIGDAHRAVDLAFARLERGT